MKFKVGDKVRAINNNRATTNKHFGWEGVVVEVNKNDFSARTTEHGRVDVLGNIYINLNYDDFELLNSNPVHDVDMLINELINNNVNLFNKVDFKYEIKAKKPILDDIEKRYLSNVIKPFRDKVTNIIKNNYDDEKYQYICIKIKNEWSAILLPNFIKDTMYKGMEVNKNYNLEELGL